LKAYAKGTYEAAVELGRFIFNEVHTAQIEQLLYCYPKDHKTE